MYEAVINMMAAIRLNDQVDRMVLADLMEETDSEYYSLDMKLLRNSGMHNHCHDMLIPSHFLRTIWFKHLNQRELIEFRVRQYMYDRACQLVRIVHNDYNNNTDIQEWIHSNHSWLQQYPPEYRKYPECTDIYVFGRWIISWSETDDHQFQKQYERLMIHLSQVF